MATTTPPLNVLVADPDAGSRGLLAELLERAGFRATALEDPSKAPTEIRDGRYQMVFLGLAERCGSSVEVLREIRALDDDLCVICLTDTPSVESAVETMKHRAFDYLQKPVSEEVLLPRLRAAIKEHGLLVNVEERLNARIGRHVRTRRHELGLTLKQLANRTALSVSLISQIELGRSAASVLSLYKLATALDVPMAYFFQSV
jgi:DNA-binding NtrC family response regulator